MSRSDYNQHQHLLGRLRASVPSRFTLRVDDDPENHQSDTEGQVMAITDVLWGGILTGVLLDPASHECKLHVEIIVDGMRSIRVMVCRGVTEFHFRNQIPNPWTYAEVTEVKADFDPRSDTWFLEMMLWSEDAGLTLRCVRIDMDGYPKLGAVRS